MAQAAMRSQRQRPFGAFMAVVLATVLAWTAVASAVGHGWVGVSWGRKKR